MSRGIPHNFRIQYSQDTIAHEVKRLGAEISVWGEQVWQSSHTDLLVIPVLRGAIFFFADLVRHIRPSIEIAPVRTWAYDVTLNRSFNDVKLDLSAAPVKGRSVLLVDDICDSGRTLLALREGIQTAGALEVRSVVLIRRQVTPVIFTPDWVGLVYVGPEWFVGYGMDDQERFRNLPDIYTIQQGQ